MKTKTTMKSVTGLAMAGLILAGCVPSLNPLYTEEDLLFEPKLVGVWAEEDDAKERWTFEQAGEKAYKVSYEQGDERGEFEVHLLRLGKDLYLDFFPDKEAIEKLDRHDFYKFHWLPAHTFARVHEFEPELRMAFMDGDWLNDRLAENESLIAHVRRGEKEIVLTASTKALQEFVRKHAAEAFGDISNLKRLGK